MEIREMAEAHLKNVQQQIQELQQNRDRIDVDIKALNDYLQQGVTQLNAVPELQPPPEDVDLSGRGVSIPSLTLPGQ